MAEFSYTILTDSASDLRAETAAELGLEVLPLSLHIGGAVYRNYLDGRELDTPTFYHQLREGGILPTTGVSSMAFALSMEAPSIWRLSAMLPALSNSA